MRLVLAYLLGIATALVLPAIAAENASDYQLVVDISSVDGSIRRTLVLEEHHPVETSTWSGQRQAAATSLASWLSWLQTNDAAGYAWVSGKSSTVQEGLRQALLKGQ